MPGSAGDGRLGDRRDGDVAQLRAEIFHLVRLAREKERTTESLHRADEGSRDDFWLAGSDRVTESILGAGRNADLRGAASAQAQRRSVCGLFGERELDGGLLPGFVAQQNR